MQDFAIDTKNNLVRILDMTYDIDEFKNRCIKFHENRNLDDAITYGEAETLIRLGFIACEYCDERDRDPDYEYLKCDKYTLVTYVESRDDGGFNDRQVIDAICGDHYPVTSFEVIETIYYAGDHAPQGVHRVLRAVCDALDELHA